MRQRITKIIYTVLVVLRVLAKQVRLSLLLQPNNKNQSVG
jgi:hypothetical protein